MYIILYLVILIYVISEIIVLFLPIIYHYYDESYSPSSSVDTEYN